MKEFGHNPDKEGMQLLSCQLVNGAILLAEVKRFVSNPMLKRERLPACSGSLIAEADVFGHHGPVRLQRESQLSDVNAEAISAHILNPDPPPHQTHLMLKLRDLNKRGIGLIAQFSQRRLCVLLLPGLVSIRRAMLFENVFFAAAWRPLKNSKSFPDLHRLWLL